MDISNVNKMWNNFFLFLFRIKSEWMETHIYIYENIQVGINTRKFVFVKKHLCLWMMLIYAELLRSNTAIFAYTIQPADQQKKTPSTCCILLSFHSIHSHCTEPLCVNERGNAVASIYWSNNGRWFSMHFHW